MNPGSAAARHALFGGMHDVPKVTGYEFDTGNLGNLGNNPHQTVDPPVVDLTHGDDDRKSEENNQVQLHGDVVLRLPHQRIARGRVPA